VTGHVTGASSYEVTTLRPRGVAVGRHQGVRPTSHLQGTFGSPSRRVRPLQDVAHNHSLGYSQPRRGILRSSLRDSRKFSLNGSGEAGRCGCARRCGGAPASGCSAHPSRVGEAPVSEASSPPRTPTPRRRPARSARPARPAEGSRVRSRCPSYPAHHRAHRVHAAFHHVVHAHHRVFTSCG
jgi:hypothetical protein